MSDLSFEDIVDEIKADLIEADPSLAPALELESEPIVKLIEIFAYRLVDMQTKINHIKNELQNA